VICGLTTKLGSRIIKNNGGTKGEEQWPAEVAGHWGFHKYSHWLCNTALKQEPRIQIILILNYGSFKCCRSLLTLARVRRSRFIGKPISGDPRGHSEKAP
jgi:hypothetical protein